MNLSRYVAGEPLQLDDQPQLLLDDALVEDRWRLTAVVQSLTRDADNPILAPTSPWEGDRLVGPSVLWDERRGLYRMWYTCWSRHGYHTGESPATYVAYAESDDGRCWRRPLFTHCPYGAHAETNIVYYGTHRQGPPERRHQRIQKGQVFIDERDPLPARRYKMVCLEGWPLPDRDEVHSRLSLAISADGIHWHLDDEKPLLDYHSDCQNHVVWEPRSQRYLLYCRPPIFAAGWGHHYRNYRRRVAVMSSPDLRDWSYPRTVLYPDERDWPDFDIVSVFRYGSHLLMLLGVMQGDGLGEKEIQLASSVDGLNWQRTTSRQAWLSRGAAGAFDAGAVIPGGEPLRIGDRLLFYYAGSDRGQHDPARSDSGIGLATAPCDRFVAQRAADRTGYLLTREFTFDGKQLLLNYDASSAGGAVRIELLQQPPVGCHADHQHAGGMVCPGFALADCDPLVGDDLAAVVSWQGNSDLSALAGLPVYLRLQLDNADAYAFRFG